jgi:hypothetical protein
MGSQARALKGVPEPPPPPSSPKLVPGSPEHLEAVRRFLVKQTPAYRAAKSAGGHALQSELWYSIIMLQEDFPGSGPRGWLSHDEHAALLQVRCITPRDGQKINTLLTVHERLLRDARRQVRGWQHTHERR